MVLVVIVMMIMIVLLLLRVVVLCLRATRVIQQAVVPLATLALAHTFVPITPGYL